MRRKRTRGTTEARREYPSVHAKPRGLLCPARPLAMKVKDDDRAEATIQDGRMKIHGRDETAGQEGAGCR